MQNAVGEPRSKTTGMIVYIGMHGENAVWTSHSEHLIGKKIADSSGFVQMAIINASTGHCILELQL